MPDERIKKSVLPAESRFDLDRFCGCPGTVLIVAPHPDDDIIGAGGAMAILAQSGPAVFSLYVTDGSTSSCCPAVREREACDALKAVHARAGFFLRQSSGQLEGRAGRRAATEKIRSVFDFLRPESVYVPSPFEGHVTHRRVTALCVSAIRQISRWRPSLWGYHVWGGLYGLPGTRTVDISRVMGKKRRALRMHKSQLAFKAYDAGIAGRNRYEGVYMETHAAQSVRFAESFIDMQELVADRRVTLRSFAEKKLGELLGSEGR